MPGRDYLCPGVGGQLATRALPARTASSSRGNHEPDRPSGSARGHCTDDRGQAIAAWLVATRRYADRHHSIAAVSADTGADGGVRVAGQATARPDDDDPVDRAGCLRLRGDRQEYPDPSQCRWRRDHRDLPAILPGLRAFASGAGDQVRHRLHQAVEFPLSVHLLHHRRQHPWHAARCPDQGLPEGLRAADHRLYRRRHRGHRGRLGTGTGCHPHVVLHRRADHGRRSRRRCAAVVARLCHHHPPAAGRHLRHDPSCRDARQPDGDHICRARSTISASAIRI